jgi:hypothetical protein
MNLVDLYRTQLRVLWDWKDGVRRGVRRWPRDGGGPSHSD